LKGNLPALFARGNGGVGSGERGAGSGEAGALLALVRATPGMLTPMLWADFVNAVSSLFSTSGVLLILLAVVQTTVVAIYLRDLGRRRQIEQGKRPAASEPLQNQLRLHPTHRHLESFTDGFHGAVDGLQLNVTRSPTQLTVTVQMPQLREPMVSVAELGLPGALPLQEPLLTATLNAAARAELRSMLNVGVIFRERRVQQVLPRSRVLPLDVDQVRSLVTSVRKVFVPIKDVPAALLANLRELDPSDPDALPVMRRNLRVLMRYCPSSPACKQARAMLSEATDPDLQAMLAIGRGDAGTATLVSVLSAPLTSPGPLISAAEQLGRMRHAPALPGLLHLLNSEHPEVVVAALGALRKLRKPNTARAIFGVMESPSAAAREAAVAALGDCGDAWAAAALKGWAKRNRRDRAVASAARLTAARLHDRFGALTEAEAGSLSMVGEEEALDGALSLPKHQAGQVSLVEKARD